MVPSSFVDGTSGGTGAGFGIGWIELLLALADFARCFLVSSYAFKVDFTGSFKDSRSLFSLAEPIRLYS